MERTRRDDTHVLLLGHCRQRPLPAFTEAPRDLLIEPKIPEEMTFGELGRYIASLNASGNDTRKLRVQRAVKLALPAACLIIALFGAPLAVSAPRAGPAVGIAISLGTTIVYLLMINLSQAVGASGVIDPTAAAWVPNAIFLAIGLWCWCGSGLREPGSSGSLAPCSLERVLRPDLHPPAGIADIRAPQGG